MSLEVVFDRTAREAELTEIEKKTLAPGFWNDQKTAKKIMKRKGEIESELARFDKLAELVEDAEVLITLAIEGEDEDTASEADLQITEAETAIAEEEIKRILGKENDRSSAIISINPGAGGTEAQDWADMLFRMYQRWAEARGYDTEIVDYTPGDEAGIKTVTMLVKGEFAYGYLKAEMGVHRLVRISPYDAAKRRHTSFTSVFVYPEVADDVEIEINEAELRIDTYRASGAGGQHVNKTDSAVRITHLPTNVVVQCQSGRSQHKNKETALKLLKARLYEERKREEEEKMGEIHKDKQKIEWGSQIRSYVLQPYRMVKDHRTNVETGDVDSVLDGSIDKFIDAYLMFAAGIGVGEG